MDKETQEAFDKVELAELFLEPNEHRFPLNPDEIDLLFEKVKNAEEVVVFANINEANKGWEKEVHIEIGGEVFILY